MKMLLDKEKQTHGQLNTIDRVSDLPDCILHLIISFLGTKQACRTSVLSKRWTNIWSTGLILYFAPYYFRFQGEVDVGKEAVHRFKKFVDTTLQRYSDKKWSVRKIILENLTDDMAEKIDEWLEIVAHIQVEKLTLSITGPDLYDLPAALFAAKSLFSIKLYGVGLTYCDNLQLMSLQSLDLTEVEIDECMLQAITMSCPLRIMKLYNCWGFRKICIPHWSSLNLLDVSESFPDGGTIAVDTCSLRIIDYAGCEGNNTWLFTLKPGSMKNLRELKIRDVVIKKYVFVQLVAELVSIEIMMFDRCRLPEKISVSSRTLKELRIYGCVDVINVEIDAPQLDTFSYFNIGDLGLSSVISNHGDACLCLYICLETQAFLKLRKLLSKSKAKRCKVLQAIVIDHSPQDQVSEIRDGMASDVQELKRAIYNNIRPESSHIAALLDGLSWSCSPNFLYLVITFDIDNLTVKDFLEVLEEKVTRWKHLFRLMESESTNCPSLFLTWELKLQLRVYW